MTTTFQRPENAIKRADELISVGQKLEALNVLHSIISHRKLKVQGWDLTAELIMMKHIKLCVELERFKIAREGLHFYRFITQQQNVMALAKAMRELRDLSEAKLKAVKSKISADQAAAEVSVKDDLEADETPESLLLSTLQVEVRDRSAEVLHKALLGCWESYKIIMDLLRYAPKIDYVYHETAQKALEFCRVNNRSQEFRRLCDTLRLHYQNVQKQRGRPDFENFLRPETHLTTRLVQLSVAANLNLWNQCLQTAEDIVALGLHELLQRSISDKDSSLRERRGELLKQTALFYEKLAMIFRVSDRPLFHASAVLHNLFHTRRHKKTISPEEQEQLSDIGTLAVLCVPITDQTGAAATDSEGQRKLASMLGHGGISTRAGMKTMIEAQGIVHSASDAVRRLYHLVEAADVDPLTLCVDALPSITTIEQSPSLASYSPALKRVIFEKLLIKLSKIYTSLSIEFFTTSLCPKEFIPWSEAEPLIIHQLAKPGVVQLRFDYSRHALLFGSTTASPDSILRNRLAEIARVLSNLVPSMGITGYKKPEVFIHDSFYSQFQEKLDAEGQRLMHRNAAIVDRRKKEDADKHAREMERQNKEKEKQKKDEVEEQERRDAAAKYHEELRRKEEQQQLKAEVARYLVTEFKAVAEKAIGKILIKGKAIDEITAEDIVSNVYEYKDYEKALEELRSRERQEKARQRRLETKRVEYLVRALREEEAPLLIQWKEDIVEQDAAFLKEAQNQEEKEKKQKWDEAQELRQILVEIKPYKDEWVNTQMEQRRALWVSKIKGVLKSKKLERLRQRQREDEERLRKEEEQRQIEAQQQEILKREKEEKERLAALERAAQMQRLKELEIEQKQEKERMERQRMEEGVRSIRGECAPALDARDAFERPAMKQRPKELEIEKKQEKPDIDLSWRKPSQAPPAQQQSRTTALKPTVSPPDLRRRGSLKRSFENVESNALMVRGTMREPGGGKMISPSLHPPENNRHLPRTTSSGTGNPTPPPALDDDGFTTVGKPKARGVQSK